MLRNLKEQFESFPLTFRVLIAGTFIDRVGGALIFPFLSLYVAQRFNVGMTEVGLLFGVWSVSSLIGSMIGGALADKFGRKVIMIYGLIFSAFTALLMGFVNDIRAFYFIALFAGIFSDIGGPAQQAMVADLLEGEKRAEGFGLVRVVGNLAMTIGPAIGGLLAGISYLLLFIIDACASTITAVIVYKTIPETKPERMEGQPSESVMQTLKGYLTVSKDGKFMAFIMATVIMVLVYTQMYSTLPVFLNRFHGVSTQGFGYLMSMNAAMVVIMQFGITRRIRKFQPMLMMMAASFLYGIGYVMFGFVDQYVFFMMAMAIITIGEMIHIPVAQALVASFAPENMRGRYMATYGLGWAIPNSVAALLAGLVMDNYNPNLLWYIAGALSLVAVASFWRLQVQAHDRLETAAANEAAAKTE
jgi:MFS family permease